MQKKIKILIIDDDEVDVKLLSRVIHLSGCAAEIFSAGDVKTGAEIIASKNPDFILLDYSLPGTNGLNWLQQLNRQENKIPVVIVTGRGDEKVAVQAIKLGAKDYISKNRIFPELMREVINGVMHPDGKAPASKNHHDGFDANSLADHSPVIQYLVDASGVIRLCKGKWIEKLSLKAADILNKSVLDVADFFPVSLDDIKKALTGTETSGDAKAGNRHFTVHYVPHHDGPGKVHAVSCFAIDFTKAKESEAALQTSLDEARELRKIKEAFLANMSHEIRTPIHGILNLADILLKGKLSGEQHKFLKAIKKSADSLLVIINDILDISKIEANKMTIEQAPFCLAEVINMVYDIFKPKAEDKNIAFELVLDKNLPETVVGDSVRYSQIVNNLVNNAMKFTETGSVKLEVSLTEANDNFCVLTTRVVDTGIGIARKKLNTIFDSFAQASDDITRKYGGTGLGLSICKSLVEMQGDTMQVESEPDHGSDFSFRLPFELYNAPSPVVPAPAVEKDESHAVLHLLVVEDNDINAMVVKKIINDWGFTMQFATNGGQAVDMVAKNRYDVVLMDIEMPGMNGYEAARAIRQLGNHGATVPVMAMTAHANAREKEKCIQAGMDDYISKPFESEELKAKLLALHKSSAGTPAMRENATTAAVPVPRVTDLTYLKKMAEGNDDFFRDFITLFLDNTPAALADLEKAHASGDWESVRFIAHKLKPSLSYIGMKEIHQLALWLETSARNQANLNDMPDAIKKIITACKQACLELETELKSQQV